MSEQPRRISQSTRTALFARLCLTAMILGSATLTSYAADPELDTVSLPPQARWPHNGAGSTGSWDALNNPAVGPATPSEQVQQQLDQKQAEADDTATSAKSGDPKNPVIFDMPTVTQTEDVPVQDFYASPAAEKKYKQSQKYKARQLAARKKAQPVAQGLLMNGKPRPVQAVNDSRTAQAGTTTEKPVSMLSETPEITGSPENTASAPITRKTRETASQTTLSAAGGRITDGSSVTSSPAEPDDTPINTLMSAPARSLEHTAPASSATDEPSRPTSSVETDPTLVAPNAFKPRIPGSPIARQDIPLPKETATQTRQHPTPTYASGTSQTNNPLRLSPAQTGHAYGPAIQSMPGYDPTYQRELPPGVSISAPAAMSQPVQLNHSAEQSSENNYSNLAIADSVATQIQALSHKAIADFKANRLSEARTEIAQVLSLNHNNPALLAALGEIEVRNHNLNAAAGAYSEAARLSPDNYLQRYAEVLSLNHQREKAIMVLDQILASPMKNLTPSQFGKTYYMLGTLYEELGQTTKAAQYLQQALSFMPNNADTNFNLGLAYELMGNTKFAQKYYKRAVKLDPSATDARLALSRMKG